MRPQPVIDHGQHERLSRLPGPQPQAFTRLGLRPGDLVTAINGTPLDDRDRGEQILRTLSSSSEAHVTVMRNGQQQDLTLNIAQVAQEADSAGRAVTGGAGARPPMRPPSVPPPPAAGAPRNRRRSSRRTRRASSPAATGVTGEHCE